MLIRCDNCNKKIVKYGNKSVDWKHHFCNRKCYTAYRLKHPRMTNNHNKKYNWDMQQKLTKLAKLRKKST